MCMEPGRPETGLLFTRSLWTCFPDSCLNKGTRVYVLRKRLGSSLCPDPGLKNGEKKLRTLVQRTPEWANTPKRLWCAEQAEKYGLNELVEVLREKDAPGKNGAPPLEGGRIATSRSWVQFSSEFVPPLPFLYAYQVCESCTSCFSRLYSTTKATSGIPRKCTYKQSSLLARARRAQCTISWKEPGEWMNFK